MPTKKNSRAQAKKDRAKLKKLKTAGLYTGKIDGRKKPTPAQKRLISKFKDVLTGKAKVLHPKNARDYKDVFTVKNGAVIVPASARRKGERLRVNKQGEIVSSYKVGGVPISARYEKVAKITAKNLDENAWYRLPLIRGYDHKGKPIFDYKRIPGKALFKVMAEYKYKNWQKFILIERARA